MQDVLVMLDSPDPWETLDPLDPTEIKVCPERLDPPALVEPPERGDLEEKLERPDPLALQDLWDSVVIPESLVSLVLQERGDPMEGLDQWDLEDPLERTEMMVPLDPPDLLEPLDPLESPDPQVRRPSVETPAPLAPPVPLESLALLDVLA